MRATMDLMGLYLADNSIFDLVQLPEGIDKQILIDNLLGETAELEIIYPDPDFMKSYLFAWSSKQVHVWDEMLKTMQYEYNPIWNKDGTITETRNLAGSDDYNRTYTDTETRNFTGSASNTTGGTTTNDVFGFNTETAAHESGSSSSVTSTGSTTDTGTGSHSVTDGSSRDTTDTGTITRVEQGNIGVTSTQQLIREQRDVVQFNVMDYIIADFKKRFCLLIY